MAITTFCWLVATLLTRPVENDVLLRFCKLVKPGGPGWASFIGQQRKAGKLVTGTGETGWDVPMGLLCMLLSCIAVYSTLFGVGYWIYDDLIPAAAMTAVALISTGLLVTVWRRFI